MKRLLTKWLTTTKEVPEKLYSRSMCLVLFWTGTVLYFQLPVIFMVVGLILIVIVYGFLLSYHAWLYRKFLKEMYPERKLRGPHDPQ